MSLRGYYEKCWGDLVRGIRVKGVGYGNRALYGKGTRTSGTGTETGTETGKKRTRTRKEKGQAQEKDRAINQGDKTIAVSSIGAALSTGFAFEGEDAGDRSGLCVW